MRRIATVLLVLTGAVLTSAPAAARWKQDYATASPEVRAWYQRQETTAETRKRLGAKWYKFCCDDADLPLNFHPAAIRASANVTPFGAVSVPA